MPTTPEAIAEIMLSALNGSDALWNALPEDNDTGDDLIRQALAILMRRASEICSV